MIAILLYIPISYCIYLYLINFNNKKYLFIELYLALNVIAYCAYYLLAYRIHHSYEDLNQEAFLGGISTFYILFLITLALVFCSKWFYKKFSYLFSKFKKVNINKAYDESYTKLIVFLSLGFVLFFINRSGLLLCDDTFIKNLNSYHLLEGVVNKIHTFSYFGFYLVAIGLNLFHLKLKDLKYNKTNYFFYYILLSIFIVIILNSSASVSLIIQYSFISLLILHAESKKKFFTNLIFLLIILVTFQSVKKDLRENITALTNDCKLNIITNSGRIINSFQNFYNIKLEKKYFLRNGDWVYLGESYSYSRFVLANMFERVDFLQMLSQTKLMQEKNELKLKFGQTYLNPYAPWQKTFGVDIKQANQGDISSFNMPASVESYYNFGIIGYILYSLFMGILIFFINFALNQQTISTTSKVSLIATFSPLLYLEQHLIFMLKNSLYTFLLIVATTLFAKIIFSITNNKFN
jgi:hypothetical protein